MKTILVLSAIGFVCVFGRGFDNANNPSLAGRITRNIRQLPLSGRVSKVPWSCDYWPSRDGGIANRWQVPGSSFTNYRLYTLAELLAGAVDINILSPAEKYDIYMSRYDYPLVIQERARNSPNDASWEGICHGWSAAAINYNEPGATTVINAEGISIPFAASDVKALLSYFLGVYAVSAAPTWFVGSRCNGAATSGTSQCWDANPGTIHILLGNLIGLQNASFIADVVQGAEVWNQPLVGYRFTPISTDRAPTADSAAGTVTTSLYQVALDYTAEMPPSITAEEPSIVTKTFFYTVDLASDGTILGGSYQQSQNTDWLDFLWFATAPEFFGYFTSLREIYKQATGNLPDPVRPVPVLPTPTIVNNSTVVPPPSGKDSKTYTIPNPSGKSKSFAVDTGSQTQVDVFEFNDNEIGAPIAPKDNVFTTQGKVIVVTSQRLFEAKDVKGFNTRSPGVKFIVYN